MLLAQAGFFYHTGVPAAGMPAAGVPAAVDTAAAWGRAVVGPPSTVFRPKICLAAVPMAARSLNFP